MIPVLVRKKNSSPNRFLQNQSSNYASHQDIRNCTSARGEIIKSSKQKVENNKIKLKKKKKQAFETLFPIAAKYI